MSIGVCCAATIIYFYPNATMADPICTFVFSVIVCVTVIPVMKKCVIVLMEGSPPGFDTEKLVKDINACGEENDDLVMYKFNLW
jgi:zinc transporter 2